MTPLVSPEVLFAVSAIVIVFGMRLCWRAPRMRMSAEERAKDGRLSPEEAQRRIRMLSWWGPAVTFAGLVLLAMALGMGFAR